MHPLNIVLILAAVLQYGTALPHHHRRHHRGPGSSGYIELREDGETIILTCHLESSSHIQWFVNTDIQGGLGDPLPAGDSMNIEWDDLGYVYTYKYTCCAGGGVKCASRVISRDPPCQDPVLEPQWPAVTHTEPLQLPCEGEIFKNGEMMDDDSVEPGLRSYGLYTCRTFSEIDGDNLCYRETSTQYLSEDCGKMANNDPDVFTVDLQQRHTGELYCRGFLISDKYIITAAHCVDGTAARYKHVDERHHFNIKVLVGARNQQQVRNIAAKRDIIVHPKFFNNHIHDIALLRLSENVTLGAFRQPICLGRDNLNVWANRTSATLVKRNQAKRLDVVQQCGSCVEDGSSVCVSSRSGVSCVGDSGSPLVVDFDGQAYASGLVSRGQGGGHCSTCTTFTRLDKYYDWIAETLKPKKTKKGRRKWW